MEKIEKFKAILFDFDGVLADTMEDNFLAWEKAFSEHGIRIKRGDFFPFEGLPVQKIAQTIAEKHKIRVECEEMARLKNKYYLQNYSFSLYPGAIELIDLLKSKRKKIAVVSASPKERLDEKVKGFLRKFDAVILGGDTEKGKPYPEPYLKAAERLKVKPEKCVVVENAPLGIKAAKNANMYCIALTTTLEKSYLNEADEVIESLDSLKDRFKN